MTCTCGFCTGSKQNASKSFGDNYQTEFDFNHRATETDPVKHPAHYARLKPEPRDVIAAWGLSYGPSSAIKYIARAGHKAGNDVVTDYRKAIEFLEWEIRRCG